MNDKRMYRSRSPNVTHEPKTMESVETGNPAVDGYEVRHREPLRGGNRSRRLAFSGEKFAAPSLMDDQEAEMRDIYGSDY
jgi:hypothetical protein